MIKLYTRLFQRFGGTYYIHLQGIKTWNIVPMVPSSHSQNVRNCNHMSLNELKEKLCNSDNFIIRIKIFWDVNFICMSSLDTSKDDCASIFRVEQSKKFSQSFSFPSWTVWPLILRHYDLNTPRTIYRTTIPPYPKSLESSEISLCEKKPQLYVYTFLTGVWYILNIFERSIYTQFLVTINVIEYYFCVYLEVHKILATRFLLLFTSQCHHMRKLF